MNFSNTLQLVREAHAMIRENCPHDSIEVEGELLHASDLARDLDALCWTLEKARNVERDNAAMARKEIT